MTRQVSRGLDGVLACRAQEVALQFVREHGPRDLRVGSETVLL